VLRLNGKLLLINWIVSVLIAEFVHDELDVLKCVDRIKLYGNVADV
jgi:hypothetical protein